MDNKYLFTSESVSEGHPDKICDQISDAVLDAFLAQDEKAHSAVETLVTTGQVVIAGEVRSTAYVDIPSVVRKTIAEIGYTKPEYGFEANSCGILTAIHEQSPDINQGVSREDERKQGAGDQGIVFGFATDETETFMPVSHYLATLIVNSLAEIRKDGKLMSYLRPDAKSQVTVEYSEFGEPLRIDTIVVSTQHDEFGSEKAMQELIRHDVINTLIPYVKANQKTETVMVVLIKAQAHPSAAPLYVLMMSDFAKSSICLRHRTCSFMTCLSVFNLVNHHASPLAALGTYDLGIGGLASNTSVRCQITKLFHPTALGAVECTVRIAAL